MATGTFEGNPIQKKRSAEAAKDDPRAVRLEMRAPGSVRKELQPHGTQTLEKYANASERNGMGGSCVFR